MDITQTIDAVAMNVREHGDAMEQYFRQELKAAVASIATMHVSATEAIAKAAGAVNQLEELQEQAEQALAAYAAGRQEAARINNDIQSTGAQVGQIGQRLHDATAELRDAHQASGALVDRLAGIASNIDRLTTASRDIHAGFESLKASHETATQRVDEVLRQAGQASVNWQALVDETAKQSQSGATLNVDFVRMLAKGQDLANSLERGTADAARQQQLLADHLAILNNVIVRLEQKKESSWVERIFRGER